MGWYRRYGYLKNQPSSVTNEEVASGCLFLATALFLLVVGLALLVSIPPCAIPVIMMAVAAFSAAFSGGKKKP